MSVKIKMFLQKAVLAQLNMAGEVFHFERKKSRENFTARAVLTETKGDAVAQIGGLQYIISGHALIEKGDYVPEVGDRLNTENKHFQIVSVVCSPNDAAYSCDLVSLAR